ncbi:hypothetical protein UFOVP1636_274 [uncultured Caudovirales phage]|uniref:Uncharacterized protein n=1 Tax=uncultured Caudovirales phage TaxID=2100421 RepID=A0A6J5T116_9CAUD|nr:hypothetical protein UFOVP1636_274 [uncultured Caudovirales phage]
MNERIKQLAEQAGLKHYNWSTNESNIIDGDFKYPRLEDYKKFAELIVQECLNQCYNRGMDDELYAGQLKAATYIEEYFGVEE